MYIVTITGKAGSVLDLSCASEGEMLDRVRIHMSSKHIESITVTRQES